MHKYKGNFMSEETTTTTLETAEVTPEANTTVEPAFDAETQDAEVSPEESTEVEKEAGTTEEKTADIPESLKDVPEGFIKKFGDIDLSNPANANLVKSAYHSEKTMNELRNEINEFKKQSQEQEFKQQTQQVSQEQQALDYNYQQALAQYQDAGNHVLKTALDDLQNGLIDPVRYAQIVAEENSKFNNIKANMDSIYAENLKDIQGRQAQLSQQIVSNTFKEFEINNAEKLTRPENKALYEAYKAQGYDPQDLNFAFELAENYLQTYLKNEAAKKQISSDIEADKSAMTSTIGKGGKGSKPPKIQTLDDIINFY